tara:strand:- start:205 stop:561 length:357 start_codon:yes stop_codon:yes gene_type:complete
VPGFTITRGLGPGAVTTNLIARGFIPAVVAETVRIVRGGRSAASRAIKDLTESFRISAMLIASNGKELVKPIVSNVSKDFNTRIETRVKAKPLKLVARRDSRAKVSVTGVKVRNKNNE